MYGLWVYSVKTWFEISIFSAQANPGANSLRKFKPHLKASKVSIPKFRSDCFCFTCFLRRQCLDAAGRDNVA
jgi:hypothetical protein